MEKFRKKGDQDGSVMGLLWGEAGANLCLGVLEWHGRYQYVFLIEFVFVLAMSLSLYLYLGVSWGQ